MNATGMRVVAAALLVLGCGARAYRPCVAAAPRTAGDAFRGCEPAGTASFVDLVDGRVRARRAPLPTAHVMEAQEGHLVGADGELTWIERGRDPVRVAEATSRCCTPAPGRA